MKTQLAVLVATVSAAAQVVTLPTVVSTPDGVVAGFTSAQIEWWGIESKLMVSTTTGPHDFSGPILATRVRDKDGNQIKLWNFYSQVANIPNISALDTYHWDYITAAYPQGEATVSYYHQVVPEPETYALFAGLGLCAFAVWRRRGV